jgi:epoxyqueuosine reductase
MDPAGIKNEVYQHMAEQGIASRIVAVSRLEDLHREIDERKKSAPFSDQFFQDYFGWMEYQPPEALKGSQSLIVCGYPVPMHRIVFSQAVKKYPVLVPPTYLRYAMAFQACEQALNQTLAPRGFKTAVAKVPDKLLAARSGLGRYGRNNIIYLEGRGSFVRLLAFFSDLPVSDDVWHEPRMLEACEKCRACLKNCPTAAIKEERFLIQAERCLTYFSEMAGDQAFPEWIDPAWHNCLVGCLKCQSVCPENSKVKDWVETIAEFDENETGRLLQAAKIEDLPPALADKVRQADLQSLLGVIPRNLKPLLSKVQDRL